MRSYLRWAGGDRYGPGETKEEKKKGKEQGKEETPKAKRVSRTLESQGKQGQREKETKKGRDSRYESRRGQEEEPLPYTLATPPPRQTPVL